MFYNKSPRTLYLNFDGAASIKSWVVEMREGDYFELPIGADGKVFSGAIFGAWDGEGGYCRVTELVRK